MEPCYRAPVSFVKANMPKGWIGYLSIVLLAVAFSLRGEARVDAVPRLCENRLWAS